MQNGGENTKKVIIIGDGFVGKTCLVAKVTEGKFINNYHCTIGVEFGVKTVKRDGNDIKLCVSLLKKHAADVCQDRFRGLMPQYTRRSAAAIVMCDVTRRDTLEGAKLWKQSVDKSVYLPNGQPIPCVLLINKCDRPRGERQISSDEMIQFAKENNFVKCFETSVKDGTNLNEALEFVVDVILAYEEDGQIIISDFQDRIKLSDTTYLGRKQHGTCCGLTANDSSNTNAR